MTHWAATLRQCCADASHAAPAETDVSSLSDATSPEPEQFAQLIQT